MRTVPPNPASSPDPHLADVIARAERRRAVLERLTEIGMALAEEIGTRNVNAPYHPEPRHDPAGRSPLCRAPFGSPWLSKPGSTRRSLRCAMAGRPQAPASRERPFRPPQPSPRNSPCPSRAKVRDAVCEAIDSEIGDVEVARRARASVHERLIEGEDFDAILSLPWRECVAAICADLGLDPDWSLWSDEDGFALPETECSSPPRRRGPVLCIVTFAPGRTGSPPSRGKRR